MNPLVKSIGIKYGLIVAAISSGYYLIAYLFNEDLFANMGMGLAIMLSSFIILILSVAALKKQQGGYITFKDAASVFTFSWIINAAVSIVVTILLFHVIDPELGARVKEMTIETTIGMMERFGTPQEAMDEAIAKIEETDQFSIGKIFQGNLMSIVFALILGLIVAAFFKKEKPVFEDTVD
jgi:hypothetical protein